jgi:hypothetical protein
MFVIIICAVICGAERWEDSEAYGQAQAEWFHQWLDLPQDIPCHDPFRHLLSRAHPDELNPYCISWIGACRDVSQHAIVAIDGKMRCHAFDQAAFKGAM